MSATAKPLVALLSASILMLLSLVVGYPLDRAGRKKSSLTHLAGVGGRACARRSGASARAGAAAWHGLASSAVVCDSPAGRQRASPPSAPAPARGYVPDRGRPGRRR